MLPVLATDEHHLDLLAAEQALELGKESALWRTMWEIQKTSDGTIAPGRGAGRKR